MQAGGIRALAHIIGTEEEGVNLQVKEEAVWTITNLAILSQYYVGEFVIALEALMKIIQTSRAENLQSWLVLQ